MTDDTVSEDVSNEEAEKRAERGPDPSIGIGFFVVGLIVMATGGATTHHYLFNAGEGMVLLGAVIFLVSVAVTNYRIQPWKLRELSRRVIGRE